MRKPPFKVLAADGRFLGFVAELADAGWLVHRHPGAKIIWRESVVFHQADEFGPNDGEVKDLGFDGLRGVFRQRSNARKKENLRRGQLSVVETDALRAGLEAEGGFKFKELEDHRLHAMKKGPDGGVVRVWHTGTLIIQGPGAARIFAEHVETA